MINSFHLFMNDVRDRVEKDNPGISLAELGKLMGRRWKHLSEEEKTRYFEKAESEMTV